jgi:hypothetical protein
MMLNRSTRPIGNCKLGLAIAFFSLLSAVCLKADPIVEILDPQFYRVPVFDPIPGSSKTVLAYYRVDGEKLVPATAEEVTSRATIREQTLIRARALLKKLTPSTVRDSHGTITAIVLESGDPALSSILLLPEIDKRFGDILGPQILAAVPNRRTLYLFPKLASDLQLFATTILTLYHNDPWPVSFEIFAPSNGLLRVTSQFDDNF